MPLPIARRTLVVVLESAAVTYNRFLLALLLGEASQRSKTEDTTATPFLTPLSGRQTLGMTGKTRSVPTLGGLGLTNSLLGSPSPRPKTLAEVFRDAVQGSRSDATTSRNSFLSGLGLGNSLLSSPSPPPKTLAEVFRDSAQRSRSDTTTGRNPFFGGLGLANPLLTATAPSRRATLLTRAEPVRRATLLTGTAPARRTTLLTRAEPVRRLYFSFHYQRDIQRAQRVKNHWVTKGTQRAAGFFNNSLEEKAKTHGDYALKRLINAGMRNSSVTCVLIGAETWSRRWVRYEIFRSVAEGKGVFGVRIHNIKNLNGWTDYFGGNPFAYMGYGRKQGSNKLWPMVYDGVRWRYYDLAELIDATAARYLQGYSYPRLDMLFPVYDWVLDDGYRNFSFWVTRAAQQAGR